MNVADRFRILQVYPVASSDFFYTSLLMLRIRLPSSPTLDPRCQRAEGMTDTITVRYLSPNPYTRSSHRTLSVLREDRDTARNASVPNPTARITAQHASVVCLRWITTVPG